MRPFHGSVSSRTPRNLMGRAACVLLSQRPAFRSTKLGARHGNRHQSGNIPQSSLESSFCPRLGTHSPSDACRRSAPRAQSCQGVRLEPFAARLIKSIRGSCHRLDGDRCQVRCVDRSEVARSRPMNADRRQTTARGARAACARPSCSIFKASTSSYWPIASSPSMPEIRAAAPTKSHGRISSPIYVAAMAALPQ